MQAKKAQGNIVAVRTYPTGKDNEAAEKRMLMEAGQLVFPDALLKADDFDVLRPLVSGEDEATWRCCGA